MPGRHVRLGLDASGFVRELQALDATPAASSSTSTTRDRDRVITRVAVLCSAAIVCGHRATVHNCVKSADVFKIAEVWLPWVLEAEEGQ